jgi:hypothetical protein
MRRTTLAMALMFLCGCGAATGTGTGPASPAAASPIALSCATSGSASPSWPSAQSASAPPHIVSAVASGDSLQLTFAAGTPQFRVEPQSNATFSVDPSGQRVTLAGSSGVKLVLLGFQGGMSNYSGQKLMTSSGPRLLQVGAIGDFEGTVSFGAGVSGPSCASVEAGASTLTFHFIQRP